MTAFLMIFMFPVRRIEGVLLRALLLPLGALAALAAFPGLSLLELGGLALDGLELVMGVEARLFTGEGALRDLGAELIPRRGGLPIEASSNSTISPPGV